MPEREVWLRGPVEGVAASLVPAAHALLQAREDLEDIGKGIQLEELWQRPGGAASVGFHLMHMAGSLDRLYTYARGEQLSPTQWEDIAAEKEPKAPLPDAQQLLQRARATIDHALEQLRRTPESAVLEPRGVGRKMVPSTARDLLHHGAQHLFRHVGQLTTTLKVIRGLR